MIISKHSFFILVKVMSPYPTLRYFNYRTTRFLTEEGFYKFHNWFDDRAWYPLGRIIGGTIYPGRHCWRIAQVNKHSLTTLEMVVYMTAHLLLVAPRRRAVGVMCASCIRSHITDSYIELT